MDLGVLADIKRIQMKAKCLNLSDKRVEPPARQAQPSMRGQAVPQECHIVGKVLGIWIGVWMQRRVTGRFQAVQYKCHIPPIGFLRSMAQRVLIDDRKGRDVTVEGLLKGG
jgi:hypothetical protein